MTWDAFKKALRRPVCGSAFTRRRDRGIALLMVLGSVAILTAVAVDFQYNSTVDLQMAANARDDLRAEYLARSAVNMSRLLLKFQRTIDSTAGGAGGIPGLPKLPPIRLWDIVPIDCSGFTMLLGGKLGSSEDSFAPAYEGGTDEERAKDSKPKATSFGDFSGCFQAKIEDEEPKINLNSLDFAGETGQAPKSNLLSLLSDPRFEFVFDKSDANGVRTLPAEVVTALHDWIDENTVGAQVNPAMSGPPFADAFGDENRNYASKYEYRYKAKNAQFDSLDELYQVDGGSDLFMAAFRDRLTVYPDKNRVININNTDPIRQIHNIMISDANPNDPKLRSPITIQAILQQFQLARLLPFMGLTVQTYASILESNGITVRPEVKSGKWVSDKSETFTIKATGQAGNVERTVTAVIRSNDGLGKLLYYRIE